MLNNITIRGGLTLVISVFVAFLLTVIGVGYYGALKLANNSLDDTQRNAAAKEIKALIGDSAAQVEQGASLVAEASRTMNDAMQSVERVTGIMGEIEAAALEQSDGIEQVNKAVSQIDEVTQYNAALVEEAAAAAKSLDEQAAVLREAVAVFRVSDGSTRHASYAAAPASATPEALAVS